MLVRRTKATRTKMLITIGTVKAAKRGGKKFMKCSRCKNVRYCSRDSWVKHSHTHKTECKRGAEYTEAVEMIHKKIDDGNLKAYLDWDMARMK